MRDSCPHHDGWLVARSLCIMIVSTSTDTRVSISTWQETHLRTKQSSTWHVSISPSVAPLQILHYVTWVKTLRHSVLLGEFLPPSADIELSGQKFCLVQGFVLLWLLLLWLYFEDDAPGCIDLNAVVTLLRPDLGLPLTLWVVLYLAPKSKEGLSGDTCHSLLSCPCVELTSILALLPTYSVVMRSVWITAVAFYAPPMHVLLWGLRFCASNVFLNHHSLTYLIVFTMSLIM